MASTDSEADLVHADPTLWDRFWTKVDVGALDECWQWTATRSAGRYGAIKVGGKYGRDLKAHRVQAIWRGDDVAGRVVMHSCDNTGCVNPGHLVTATQLDNVQDMLSKGRANKASGQGHGNSFLTNAVVEGILRALSKGMTPRQLAEQSGLNYLLIYRIGRREVYADVAPHISVKLKNRRESARSRSSATPELIASMRKRYVEVGNYSQVAREFGLRRLAVARIVKGERWGGEVAGEEPILVRPAVQRERKGRKLTAEQIAEIRATPSRGGLTRAQLATKFGVSVHLIASVRGGRSGQWA